MTDEFDVLVLRRGTHGMPIEQYAEALRTRLERETVAQPASSPSDGSDAGREATDVDASPNSAFESQSDPDVDSPLATVSLARTPTEEQTAIQTARIVTGTTIDESLVERAEKMRVFACAYAGADHLPLEALRERNVTVTNAAGVHGPNVAEHVLGAILTFSRRFHVGARRQRRRTWRHYQAHELQGSTVTVVGLGTLGRSICDRLDPFGVETIGVRYSPEKGGPADEIIGFDADAFHDALARTDYLVLACPLTDLTRGLIDREAFHTLPPNAVVVNVARGPVVDTDALLEAIQSNRIRGASLDVTDPEPLPETHPLWAFENVQITPHNAGHTPQYYERLADIVAENVRRIRETGSYDDLVNRVEY